MDEDTTLGEQPTGTLPVAPETGTAPPASDAPTLLSTAPPQPTPAPAGHVFVPRWLAILVALLVVGALGYAIGYAVTPDDSSAAGGASSQGPAPSATPNTGGSGSQGNTPAPNTTPPTGADPSASVLADLGLRQGDLTPSMSLTLIPGGNRVSGQPTLDLCNGTFPSEAKRSARLQVAAVDAQDATSLSTESVLYSSAADTQQAFAELKSVAAKCPSTPVESPVGEPTTATTFNAAPDADWPQVAGVERQAYDLTTTDESGESARSVAVYLRRGRALMGIYFPQPDGAQHSVAGQTTVAGIVDVFAKRLAALPDSVVNR